MIKEKMQQATDRVNLLKALEELLNELDMMGPVPNNVEQKEIYNPWMGVKRVQSVPKDFALYYYATDFFNIIAKFQDSKVLKPGLLSDAKSANELIDHINNCGRCEYGWVRSKPGEHITEDNVYLGDVFGIWTNTIKHFKEVANNKNDSGRDFVQWAIQVYQLQTFLKNHVEPMKKLIRAVLANEKTAKRNIVDSVFNKIAERGQRR